MRKKAIQKSAIPAETIASKIYFIRGQKVMLDRDLAELYGVATKRLNEQVRRNAKRFPDDFMFQLTSEEKNEVVAICDHLSSLKYSKALPLAFTEHGAIMAASILNTQRAIDAGILVVRAFVKMRQMIVAHFEMASKLKKLEKQLKNHDENFRIVFEAIKQLFDDEEKPIRKIGYIKEKKASYGKQTKKKKTKS
jgi:hypothetical protein